MEYDYDGQTFEQDIICAIMVMNTYSSILWHEDKIFVLKPVKGKLDQNCKLFKAIINSFKIDINWYNKWQRKTVSAQLM